VDLAARKSIAKVLMVEKPILPKVSELLITKTEKRMKNSLQVMRKMVAKHR
jgi:hypothetical protein